jgi:SAM-dependent methyltransferase
MDLDTMKPFGLALFDFWKGDKSGYIAICRDDGFTEEVPVGHFFRGPEQFTGLEKTALDRCRGYVLDAGAGTGHHSLALQSRGNRVCAIDVSPEAVQLMREAGVTDAREADVLRSDGGRFDTILMIGHGIGMAADISGLHGLLKHMHSLLVPDGQVLVDSLDHRTTEEPLHLAYHGSNRKAGRYIGEVRLQLRFKGHTGTLYKWLLIDPETLAKQAFAIGWAMDILCQQDDGNYLACLTGAKGSVQPPSQDAAHP